MPTELPAIGTRGTFHRPANRYVRSGNPDELTAYEGQECVVVEHDPVWDLVVRFGDGTATLALRTNFKPLAVQ